MTATTQAILPTDEAARMAAVRRYDILDTPPDGAFDRVTALAAAIFDVPIAIVSIVDEERIWFKSAHGLDGVSEIGRDPGLCASVILEAGPYVVGSAADDPRTLANPLVAGEFGLRFYAGAPLTTGDGHRLGTVCVLDTAPREISVEQAKLLEDLAAIVVDELELRLAARRVHQASLERTARNRERERQAAELNDDVVQRLAVAAMALEIDDEAQARQSVDGALEASKRLLAELVGDTTDLRRTVAAR